MSAAIGTAGITVAIGAVVAVIAYVVATKLLNKKKVPVVAQEEDKPKAAAEVTKSQEATNDEEEDVVASPVKVQFEAPQEDSYQQALPDTSEAPTTEETMIMEEASHPEEEVVEEEEDVPEGAVDCTVPTGMYGDAVNEALRSWRSQGPSALGSIVPLADTPASGSTRTDGHRWFATALVAAIPLAVPKSAHEEDGESNDDQSEDTEPLVSSGVCRLVLVNDTLSLYAIDELAEVSARRNEGRIADQHFLSIKTGGAIPDTKEDALDSPFIHKGDTLIGRLVLSNDDALAVEPTFVQSHITGAFTTTIRLAQTPIDASAPTSSTTSESNSTANVDHVCVVHPVPVAEDVVLYGPHFAVSHTSISISFETYYEAQLWYKMLLSRATIEDIDATNDDTSNSDNDVSPPSLFNELGYSSVLTAAFGRGVLAHGAKLVEDLLSAHDYIYDACAMAEGADNNNNAKATGVKVPRGFRMTGPNDFLIEPETAIIPPRAVLLHARRTTLNSLSTHASHRSCCGVGMLPTGEDDDADNQSVVLNLVDLRVGQSCDVAGSVSETLAKDYGITICRSKKAKRDEDVSVANSIVAIASASNDVLVCGSTSSECTFQPPRDYAFLEALIKVHIYNSGKPDPVENDDVVAARRKFSEPTTDPEEPVQVAYAYVRITNINGTSVVIASDENVEPQPLWAGFRCSPAASVQCRLLAPQYHSEFFGRLPAGTYDEALFPEEDQLDVIERTIAHSVRTALFEQVTLPHCVEVPSCMVNDAGSISLPPHSDPKERDPRMIHDLIEDAVAEIFPALAPLAPAAGEGEDAEPAYYAFRYPADLRRSSVDTEPSVQQEVFIHPSVEALSLSAIRETSSAPPTRAETPVTTTARDSRLKALLPPCYRDRVVTPKRGFSPSPSNCMVVECESPVAPRVVDSVETAAYNEPAPLPPLPTATAKEVRSYPKRDYIFTTPRHHRPAAMQSPLRRLIFSGESPRAGSTPLNADDSAMLRRYKELRSEMLVEEGREEELPLGTYEEKLIYAKLLEKERKRAAEEEEARFRQREQALEDALTASRNAAITEQQRNLAEQRDREAERERKATEAMERLSALEDELARTKEESDQRQIQMEIRRAAEEEARRQAEREEADRAEATLRHEEEAATLQRISNTERALEAVRNTLDSMTSAPPRETVQAASPSRASSSSSVSSSLFDSSISGSSMDSSNPDTPTRAVAENPDDSPRTRRKCRRRARHEARKIKAKRLRRLLKQKDEDEKARLVAEIERQRKEDAERQDRLAEAEKGLRELQAKVFESNQERDRAEEERRRAAQEEELKTKIEMLEAQARAMGDNNKDAEKEEALMKLMEELAEERRSSEKEREERRLRDQAEAARREEERAALEAERRARENEDRKRIEDTERALALLLAQQEREEKERDRRERENEKARKEEIRLAAEAAKAAALAAAEEDRRRYREEEERKAAQRAASQDIGDDGTKERMAAMENAVVSLQSQMCQQNDDAVSNAGSKQRTPRTLGSRVPTPRTIRQGSASKPPLPPGAASRTSSVAAAPQESEKDRLKRLKHEEKIQIRAAKAKEKEERKNSKRADDSLVEQIMKEIDNDEDTDILLGNTPASVTRDTNTLFGDMASPAPTNMTMNARELESPMPEVSATVTAEPTSKNADEETKPASEFNGSDSGYEYDGVRYSRSQPMGGAKDVSINPEDIGSDHLLTNPKHIEAAETKLKELFGGDVSNSIELVGDDDELVGKGFESKDYILTFNGIGINGRQGLLYHVYHSFCTTGESSLVKVSVLRTNGTILDVEVGDDSLRTGDIALDATNGQATIEGLLKEFEPSSRPTSRSRARDHSKTRTGSKHDKGSRRASRSESRKNSTTLVVENGGGGEVNGDVHVDGLLTPVKAHKEKKDKGDKKPKADKQEKSKKSKKEKKDKKHNRSRSNSSHSAGFFERVESAVKDVVDDE